MNRNFYIMKAEGFERNFYIPSNSPTFTHILIPPLGPYLVVYVPPIDVNAGS